MITKLERNLLVRVSRVLGEEAPTVKRSHEPWDASAESILAKRRYDRILREQRDLDALRVRLCQPVLSDG